MMRINLLPYRAEKRKERQTEFIGMCVVALLFGGAVVFLIHGVIDAKIAYQERRNEYLKQETDKLDKQIAEIKALREQTNDLLARKNVVEELQTTRSNAVHLIDQLLRILPDGVYLKTIKQVDNKINMVGAAQSNARISTLMRAIEDSPWLDAPSLVEIHGANQAGSNASSGAARISEFTMNFILGKQVVAGATAKGKQGKP